MLFKKGTKKCTFSVYLLAPNFCKLFIDAELTHVKLELLLNQYGRVSACPYKAGSFARAGLYLSQIHRPTAMLLAKLIMSHNLLFQRPANNRHVMGGQRDLLKAITAIGNRIDTGAAAYQDHYR